MPRPHPIVCSDFIVRLAGLTPLMPGLFLVFHAAGRADAAVLLDFVLWGLAWPPMA